MTNQNDVNEYVLIRDELLSVKACITTYMGYVLGGTGAGLFGMAAISKSDNGYFLAYAPAGLATTILMVLLVIFYKFSSHNRMAGYCKALSQETYESDGNRGVPVSWETCIQILRDSDRDKSELECAFDSLKLDGVNKEVLKTAFTNVAGTHPNVDRGRYWGGWSMIIMSLFGCHKRFTSWGFPIFVTNIFFVITSLFMSISAINFYRLIYGAGGEREIHESAIHVLAVIFFVVLTITIWTRLAGKLYTLMRGSATVSGFYVRFLVIRAFLIEKAKIKCSFFFSEEDARTNFINYI